MPDRSRREALAAGLAAVAALALRPAVAAAEPDQGAALTALARAEQEAVFVYSGGGDAVAGGRLAAQDREHAAALGTLLEALGLPIPGAVRSREALGPAGLAVVDATGDTARLRAAIAFEQALVDGCAARLRELEDPGILRTVATVMASHAQHLATHQRAAGRDPLSSPS